MENSRLVGKITAFWAKSQSLRITAEVSSESTRAKAALRGAGGDLGEPGAAGWAREKRHAELGAAKVFPRKTGGALSPSVLSL